MHTTKAALFTTFLYFFGNIFLLNAQADFTLLFKTSTSQSRDNFQTDQLDTKRINYLQLNNAGRNSLANLPTKMQFNLFPDVTIDVHLDKSTKTFYKNMEVYRGRSNDQRFAHLRHYRDVVVIYNPNTGKITAQIETDKGAFEISPTETMNTYKISEWENGEINCQDYFDRNALTQEHSHKATSRSGCNERDADGKYVADLFIGYSYEASVRANDIDAHALSLTEMVNNGLTNSLVENVYIRLVGTAISEHNPGVVTSVLDNVWTWFADEIALTGADYVASIQVPTDGPTEAGGWAGIGGYSSVNSINSAAAVFRHELGHNVGSNHCTPGILPYASGFSNGNVATHMCGNNINFYSTPLVNDAMGVPIGDAATADNGRVWKERAAIVSARRQHTILFDENDTACGNSALVNGRYYIQNINSDKYLATDNGSSSRGVKITQADAQNANNQWDLIGVTPNSFRMIHVVSGRYVDVSGGSSSAGTDMILWSAHGDANQIFSIDEMGTDTFTIKANNGQCLQIQAAGLIEGDIIEQNSCDNTLNTKWRFIEISGTDILNLEVTTTANVSCYGEANGTATAVATGGTGTYTYSWSNGESGTTIENLVSGNYAVTITDGATTFPYTFSIKQAAPFNTTLTKVQATSLTETDATATVVVSGGTAPYTYAWSNGNNGITATNLSAGLHDVTITDNNNCALVKEFFIDCPDKFKLCDDGNSTTFGDHIDTDCNCVGKTFTCDNGLAVANVAIGKTAVQSSTSGSADANRAIDGNRDGVFGNGSVTGTNAIEGFNAWWQVDLKDDTDITGILINNITDCCTGRLEDYHVFISTTPFTSDEVTTTQNQAGIVYANYFENATPLPNTLIELGATGRYVRIQSGSDRALNLAEVEIYACGVPTARNITANKLGENLYELKGYVIPNGSIIKGITVEHGATDFSNSNTINIASVGPSDTFFINTIVDIGNATNYQFSIKYDTPIKSYATNGFSFAVNTDYCMPTIGNRIWYKTYTKVVLNDQNFSGNGNAYDDQTAYSFGEFTMGATYPIAITTANSGWHNLTFVVYADLNNDGDFTDYNEIIGSSTPNGHTTNFSITIPTEDVLVNRDLRMRILGHEGGAFTTCYSSVGNFKDFTIRIKVGECAGTGHLVPFYADTDKDGFGDETVEIARNCSVTAVNGYTKIIGDCDDTKFNTNPNASEICGDGIDNNCDGIIDDNNVALGKTTNQSSEQASGVHTRAVDGNTSGDYNDGSVTHTLTENNPYWEVDLGESYSLDSIILWNRTNCCSNRLSNFYVFLSDTPFSSTNPTTTANEAGVWSILTVDYPLENIRFEPNATGRYLRVQINGNGILSLAEVQAYACLGIDPPSECTFYADNDGDGYGDPNQPLTQADCNTAPQGYVANNQDFNDAERTAFNGAMEICDNLDNDGNGQIDEGAEYDTDNMIFTNEIIPTEIYTASQSIMTNQTVTVETNSDVRMIAGEFITFEPGFDVEAGADFIAQINADCAAPFQGNEEISTSRIKEEQEVLNLTKTQEIVQVVGNKETIKVFPNPFSTQTSINFNISKITPVTLQVYSMNGQLVTTIIDNQRYTAGEYNKTFSTTADMKGMYYIMLKTAEELLTEKVVIIGE